MVDAEALLLDLCRLKFTSRTDFGKEYFQGNVLHISRTLLEVADLFQQNDVQDDETCRTTDEEDCLQESCLDDDVEDDTKAAVYLSEPLELVAEVRESNVEASEILISLEVSETTSTPRETDPTILLLKYIHENQSELAGPIDTGFLLGKVTSMYREAGCKSNPTLKSLFRDLKHYFKCSEDPFHVFEDGRSGHATVFSVVKEEALHDLGGDSDSEPCKPQLSGMEKFFAMDDCVRGCSIKYEEGVVTLLSEFKSSFQVERNGVVAKFVYDPTLFVSHGFSMKMGTSGKYKVENICKSCKQIATCRKKMCCDEIDARNRTTSVVIYNMAFTALQPSIVGHFSNQNM